MSNSCGHGQAFIPCFCRRSRSLHANTRTVTGGESEARSSQIISLSLSRLRSPLPRSPTPSLRLSSPSARACFGAALEIWGKQSWRGRSLSAAERSESSQGPTTDLDCFLKQTVAV